MATVARKLGFETLTLDSDPKTSPDVLVDILEWDFRDKRYYYDFVHASVPCQEFSICKTRGVRNLALARRIAGRTRAIIDHLLARNPRLLFTVENPRTSLLRHEDAVKSWGWTDCSYCCYGSPMRKDTRFWHNLKTLSLKTCSPEHCYWRMKGHPISCQHAPPEMRARIPACLCFEILTSVCTDMGATLCARMPCPVKRPPRAQATQHTRPPRAQATQHTQVHATIKRGRPKRATQDLSCSICSADDAFFYNLTSGPVMCSRCYRRTRRQANAALTES